MLPSGLPGKDDYLKLSDQPGFQELLQFSRDFEVNCQRTGSSSWLYGVKWVRDPFLQWSRRWEYVYVLQRLRSWMRARGDAARIVDAGSGFTFFPFFLQREDARATICCFDNDPTVERAMAGAGAVVGHAPGFRLEDLEQVRLSDASVDAVYSISVIEHTRDPIRVVEEMHRILKPGGIFICTFDISFEPKSPMHYSKVATLIARLQDLFEPEHGWQHVSIDGLDSKNDVVTTQWISRNFPETLPWRWPVAVWMYDALRGRLRTGLVRPMTFYCGAFVRS